MLAEEEEEEGDGEEDDAWQRGEAECSALVAEYVLCGSKDRAVSI